MASPAGRTHGWAERRHRIIAGPGEGELKKPGAGTAQIRGGGREAGHEGPGSYWPAKQKLVPFLRGRHK